MHSIDKLTRVLRTRKLATPEESYVSSLYSQGLEAILAKVAEESEETIDAAREVENQDNAARNPHLIHEVADLWFHTMVLLVHLDQDPAWVLEELDKRSGKSGHDEKASRSNMDPDHN